MCTHAYVTLAYRRGLDLYRDALSLHEKLTAYYAAMQAIPALK